MKRLFNKRNFIIQNPDFFKKNKRRRGLNKFASKLADNAIMESMCGCSPESNIRSAIRHGRPIPERYKPGRRIMSLPKEEREMVKELKQKHFNDRIWN